MAHNRPTLEQLAINFANTATVTVDLSPGVGGNTNISFQAVASGNTTGPSNPDSFPKYPHATNDEFEGNTLNTIWSANSSYSSGGAVANSKVEASSFQIEMGTAAYSRTWTQPVSGSSWKYRCKVRMTWWTGANFVAGTNYTYFSLFAAKHSTLKGTGPWVGWSDSSGPRLGQITRTGAARDAYTYYTNNVLDVGDLATKGIYLELEFDGTNFYHRFSLSGHDGTFVLFATTALSAHVISTPDVIAFGVTSESTTNRMYYVVDWFRRVGTDYEVIGAGTGPTGAQGLQGVQGLQGTQGTTGTQGLDGLYAGQGATGTQGTTGAGTQGTTGTGAQGATGTQGITGAQGATAGIGGSTTHVQFNNAGSFAGSANLRFTLASNTFSVGGADGVNGPSLDFRHSSDGMIIEEQYVNSAGSNLKFYGGGTELVRMSQDSVNPTLNVSGLAPVGLRVANANVEIFTDTTREPMMKFYRAGQGQGIGVGLLQWEGNRDDGVRVAYARLQTEIIANTVGAQTGSFQIETASAGTMANRLVVNGANVGVGAGAVSAPGSVFHVEDNANTRMHLGYQGSANYMDANSQFFRSYSGSAQLSLDTATATFSNNVAAANCILAIGGSNQTPLCLFNNSASALMNTSIRFGYGTNGYGWKITSNNNPSATYAGRLEFWRGNSSYALAGYFDNNGGLYLESGALVKGGLSVPSGDGLFVDGGSSIYWSYNTTSTYGGMKLSGSKGGYSGVYDAYSGQNLMWDASGNGGMYRESNGIWASYWLVSNACWGFGGSTTSSSYEIYVTGAIYATGDIVAFSDARLKENVYTIDNPLAKVCALRGVYFNRIDDETKRKQTGVIAQEVLEVMPEVVTHSETTDAEGNTGEEYGVNYGALVGVLIEAVKELNAKVDAQAELIRKLSNG
jgi:hypothetical protein